MNILEMILNANNGGLVKGLAKQVGIPEPLAQVAVGALLPALTRGLQRNATKPGGLDSLLGALTTGNHSRYLEQPQAATQADSIADGNAILGHILGSKDVSRNVAGKAAQQTGIDAAALKKLLPMVGTLAMGALSKQTAESGLTSQGAKAAPNGLDMLSSLLGGGGDDSSADELLDLAKRYF